MIFFLFGACCAAAAAKPHIVWVVADDLGYNDVPFTGTGSEIHTPNLSALAKGGVVLGNYYVNPICTPTRASFMTGRYPIHLGLQHGVIEDDVPDAVPINETMIAEVMRSAGYATHMVGKWHLGFHQPRYTPERRGFDTHFGYYTGNEEYWNHTSPCWECGNYTALDFHRATASYFEPLTRFTDVYSTHIFADEAVRIVRGHAASNDARPLFLYLPFEAVHSASSCERAGKKPDCMNPDGVELQAPKLYMDRQRAAGITDPFRQTFGAMVGALDEAVANISAVLEEVGMADNTVLVFTTDNGAPSQHFDGHAMSNFPLRGGKGSLFEGGVRGAAFIYSKSQELVPLDVRGTRSMALMHCTDWFPTLAALAGVNLSRSQRAALDGFDMWKHITSTGNASPRSDILHNIDPVTGFVSVRVGNYKYIQSSELTWAPDPRIFSGLPAGECAFADICPPNQTLSRSSFSIPEGSIEMLFKIDEDPQEWINLIDSSTRDDREGLELCRLRLKAYSASMVPLRWLGSDINARPHIVPGLNLCTPSPVGPILCQDVGVWRPWQPDPGYTSNPQALIV